LDERALAGAVGPHNGDDSAGRGVVVDVPQHGAAVVGDRHVVDGQRTGRAVLGPLREAAPLRPALARLGVDGAHGARSPSGRPAPAGLSGSAGAFAPSPAPSLPSMPPLGASPPRARAMVVTL